MDADRLTRRALLCAGAVIALGSPLAARARPTVPLTPSCKDGDEETPPILAGPYFKPGSPLRANVRSSASPGALLELSGRVLDTRCRPVAHAQLDFWQCNRDGVYDRRGFQLRGHQFTDPVGRYRLQTIVPNHYQRRTPHVHVKVQAAHGPVLTTQLFFPPSLRAYGMDVESLNVRDQFFDERCVVGLSPAAHGYIAKFDFIIAR